MDLDRMPQFPANPCRRPDHPSLRVWGLVRGLCLAILLVGLVTSQGRGDERSEIRDRAEAAGLQSYSSKHLTLYTDIRDSKSLEEIPGIFDLAVPQWAKFFDVAPQRIADWHMTGFVMQDADRFQRAGLLPSDLPPFLHGYQRGNQFWVYEQPSVYYRRHLVLHEGTHGFMATQFGGAGPPWYMEGSAELLATHRWDGDRRILELGIIPDSREEFAYWGRLKVIRSGQQTGDIPTIVDIMRYDSRAHLRVEPYAWSWALSLYLANEPRTKSDFAAMARRGNDRSPRFSSNFFRAHRAQWAQLENHWQAFVADLDYGSVAEPQVPTSATGDAKTLPIQVTISAKRGWQGTKILLRPGDTYELTCSSRYQLGTDPKPWWCEPQGVTLDYHRGQPLGKLLAALVPEAETPAATAPPRQQGSGSFSQPIVVGRRAFVKVQQPSWLYFKINESSGGLHDNVGELEIGVRKQ